MGLSAEVYNLRSQKKVLRVIGTLMAQWKKQTAEFAFQEIISPVKNSSLRETKFVEKPKESVLEFDNVQIIAFIGVRLPFSSQFCHTVI